MGMIGRVLDFIFGNGRNVVRETAEVFWENAETGAVREHLRYSDAMGQFEREFLRGRRGAFDRFMDAVNRLPRPMMALGCLGLFGSAMFDPVWFAARMQGVALVPEPLWWLLGVIVSFYFGARHQMKGQEFQKAMADTLSQTVALQMQHTENVEESTEVNPALMDWQKSQNR